MNVPLLCACLVAACAVFAAADPIPNTPGFAIASVASYNKMSASNDSVLFNCTLTNDPYDVPIYFLQLKGSRFQMGYDYGTLMGPLATEMYNNVLSSIIGHHPLAQRAFEMFLDWQWGYLSRQVPAAFMTELSGISQAGSETGNHKLGVIVPRVIVLANIPSDLEDLLYVFEAEMAADGSDEQQRLLPWVRTALKHLDQVRANEGLQCSQFAVWGSRTAHGTLFSARNLDYAADLGVNPYKTVMVWQPNDGAHPHASFGYSALYGALTAFNDQGVTIGEANLEVNQETFIGFPWLLRIRYVLEHSASLSQAWALWEATNNTVGYNHIIASASDVAQGHPALAIETMAGYNGFFLDNDPREANAMTVDPATNHTVQYGAPMPEALWRTNHGYDPTIRRHYMWRKMHAGKWSAQRYGFIRDSFVYYEQQSIPIGHVEAINITSIVGDKGESDPYRCSGMSEGSNMLSVTYDPADLIAYSAWDNGSGSGWTPACCNTYVAFDLSQFFAS
eukprot:TRINITY_DN1657_c0_g1_i1.p1 TRINITY_DN1657_c0_g1~~TRINITY_DN1657_c0_g1_i1.p1  ORF type:complete len:513 (-),score=145.35 TRINITY_DN1657_c0_g1_i1:122-1639(-)